MSISPQRVIDAVRAANEVIARLPDDEQLRQDTIEGETELWELMDRYAEQIIRDRAFVAQVRERVRRLEARAERNQEVVRRILDAVGVTSLERAFYTVFFVHHSHVNITEPDAVPAMYLSPDKAAIKKALSAGHEVPGATLSNPAPSLTLRAA